MSIAKFCLVTLLVTVVVGLPQGAYEEQYQQGMPYDFQWGVRDSDFGNDFGQQEQSNGDVVKGQYYVLLPDGRRQTVTYTADGQSGFQAEVQYEGEAQFPQTNGYPQGYN